MLKNRLYMLLSLIVFVVAISKAITVNPASAVLGDSDATPQNLIYRDAQGYFVILNQTTTQIQTTQPTATGQLVYNSTINELCVSTGTATKQAYRIVGSTVSAAAVRACQ